MTGEKLLHVSKHRTVATRKEKIARAAIYFFFGYQPLLLLIRMLGFEYSDSSSIFGIINAGVTWFFVMRSIDKQKGDVFLFLFVELLFFVIGTLYPGNFEYIVQYIGSSSLLLQAIPALFLFRIIDNHKKMIGWSAQIGLFALIVNSAYHFMGYSDINYMAYANLSIVNWCFIVLYARMKRAPIWFAFSIFFGILLLGFSSRGGILYIVAYGLYTTLVSFSSTKVKIVSVITISVFAYLLASNYDFLLQKMQNVSESYGLYNRVLDTLKRNVLFEDNARSQLWSQAFSSIGKSPFIGYGVCGDCVLFGGAEWYVHNFFLELLIDYGIIVGGMFIIAYIWIGAYMLFKCNNWFQKELFFVFYIVALSQTMISYSIYLNYAIYASIALFLGTKKTRKAVNPYTIAQ